MLPGAHRAPRAKPGSYHIYWRTHRGRDATTFWSCSAKTRAEAEAIEAAEVATIAERYALIAHRQPSARGFVARLIEDFKASDDWKAFAPRTQIEWTRHLDEIKDVFGATSLAAIQRRGSRKLIKAWHSSMSATPRKANIALTVLVRLFEFGIDEEDLDRNPALKISRLDEGEGRASIVWTPEDMRRLLDVRIRERPGRALPNAGEPMLGKNRRNALRLALLTGLRREDLVRLRWDEVYLDGPDPMIRRTTLKSRKKKRVAYINIGPDLRALLLEMKPPADAKVKPMTVVVNEEGKPYSNPQSFSNSLRNALEAADIRHPPNLLALGDEIHDLQREFARLQKRAAAGELPQKDAARLEELDEILNGRRKHLHDMRGTRASLLFAAGFTDAQAEAWFAWGPGQGAKMRGIYGDPETIAIAAGQKIRSVG